MVVIGIRTLFLQTVKVFIILTVVIGAIYTILRQVETVVRSLFNSGDSFYSLLNWISSTEMALWGVIGVVLLFSLLVAVLHMGERAARYVNNDSVEDDQFSFRR